MLRRGRYVVLVSLLLVVCGLPAGSWAQEKRAPVLVEVKRRPIMVEGKTFLPLRVLPRPFSNIYKEQDPAKGTVDENVPTFLPYYVYTRPEVKATGAEITGWYEVGSDNRGTVLGWMRAEDVMEWKQNMTLAYTHPEGRKPVLMFEKREALLDLIKAPSDQRKQRAEALYAAIQAKKLPADFPVRSVEPNGYVDISSQFYLLPILEFGEAGLDQYETRVLKLAAAVLKGGDAREQSTLKGNTTYLDQAVSSNLDIETLKKLETDIVFVIDMTASMEPWINATLDAVKNIALVITKDTAIRQSVHFGLWGYRDSLDNPGIEFLTKNFTPTLQPVDAFAPILQGVHEATVSSGNFDEDVFSGVNDAMTKTAWTDKALRFIVLVGDAPSHALGDRWNYSGLSAETLRQFANDHSVYIFALHAKYPDPRLASLHEQAEKQFRTLTTNKGTTDAAYFTMDTPDMNAFAQAARQIADRLVQDIAAAKKGQVPTAAAVTTPGSAQPSLVEKMASSVGHAALVEWLGRATEAKAPRDIIAWAVDKDLFDPALQSMEVRLLINKREIDELRKVLQDVMAAGRKGQIGGEDFFKVLQTTAATVARGEQSRIRQAQSMAELVPDFLQGLPYKSQLMALTNDLWASWSTDQQDDFLKGIEAKISQYAAIHDMPDKPTVCLDATSLVACSYGCDDGRIGPTHCAVIGVVLGDR
jgi:serine/threonine-protein kinase PpkA